MRGEADTNERVKRKKAKRDAKTKFEEYLEIEESHAVLSKEEDLKLERRLAKKLKVKDGKLRGDDDGINALFEGISPVIDSLGEGKSRDSSKKSEKRKKKKRKKALEEDEPECETLVGAPESETAARASEGRTAARTSESETAARASESETAARTSESETAATASESETAAITSGSETAARASEGETAARVCKSEITARASESQIAAAAMPKEPTPQSSRKYISPHLRSRAGEEPEDHSQIRRRVRGLLNRMAESNLESITAELSTIYRSVTRSVACQIFCDEVLASCSKGPRGNEQYAAVFAAFVAGMACLVGMDFSAKLLASLANTFENEYSSQDSLSLRNITLLLSYLCIFGVCSSDLIYDFLTTLSKRLTEIDVSTILTVLQCCGMKIRGDDPLAMKSFILGVQSRVNELKAAAADDQAKISSKRMEFMLETICDIKNNKKRPKEDSVQHTRIKKWLQKLRIQDVLLRGLKWSRLVDPQKKGQWWLSGDLADSTGNAEEVAHTIDKEVLEAQKMLQLAAQQRMNTDARKAIFCVIMSADDYIDAVEKLLRLDLHGKQDREITRVLVECCLQEKIFNKYYVVLASKLCEHDKNHKFSLQYCLWDHFKELESMSLQRSMHLAKFTAEMIASFTLSLAVLKVVDLTNPALLTPRRIMHFRMLFEAIFEQSDNLVWNAFTRIAVNPDLEPLRSGIKFFVKEYVTRNNKGLNAKFRKAKEALNNAEGLLM